MRNQLKKNKGSIAKLQQQHEAAIKKLAGNWGWSKQLLANEKRRSTEIKNKFDRDPKNLRKNSEQYEAAFRKLNEKHDIEVAALKNEIKRLEDFDQLKKAQSKCRPAEDENATLKKMIAQLDAESTYKNKNGNGRFKQCAR
nr:unnamed protein product [Callosobruchus chinensis]